MARSHRRHRSHRRKCRRLRRRRDAAGFEGLLEARGVDVIMQHNVENPPRAKSTPWPKRRHRAEADARLSIFGHGRRRLADGRCPTDVEVDGG